MIHKYNFYGLIMLMLSFATQSYAVIQWSGSSMTSAADENFIIQGDCVMPYNQDIYIEAYNADVFITLTDDATIQANNLNNDNIRHGIFIQVLYPYTVTIYIPKKLAFKGGAGNPTQPICIYLEGNGNIQWVLEDSPDAQLSFTADDNSGGTELWTRFSTIFPLTSPTTPNVSFEITRAGQIHFGKRSKWGYQVFSNYNLNTQTNLEHHNPYRINFGNDAKYALQIINF
ncbi:hypothetical protein EKK58_03670 [Candidatus Dependentiae bacterium]|nr:MAG: hypothetical protein EKK58_03670 [Candidatus Dependentiae bacterium]